MAFSGNQVTRLALHGGPRGLYGSFAGKAVQELIKSARHFILNVSRLMNP